MIYYHYRSKEHLYETVIQEHTDRVREFLTHVLTQQTDPEKSLLALSRFYVQVFESSHEMRPIMLREMAGGGERARRLFVQMITEVEAPERIRALFEAGVPRGNLRPLDPPQTFVSFVGMNLFYLLFSPFLNAVWEIDDEEAFRRLRPEAVVDLFLHGLRTR
jgi:AcrR family transcriptional regulator